MEEAKVHESGIEGEVDKAKAAFKKHPQAWLIGIGLATLLVTYLLYRRSLSSSGSTTSSTNLPVDTSAGGNPADMPNLSGPLVTSGDQTAGGQTDPNAGNPLFDPNAGTIFDPNAGQGGYYGSKVLQPQIATWNPFANLAPVTGPAYSGSAPVTQAPVGASYGSSVPVTQAPASSSYSSLSSIIAASAPQTTGSITSTAPTPTASRPRTVFSG